ncbi:HAMP domain-containing sensor histidine kinase [Sphingobium sp. Sx8-8]|uniref:sensor histidine kinase n=1 Tax=Sphingobium sp. Sx8-8 TaxID=2933617 RepID=UPI001F561360|nr:HAMP domain-containing sensor histidine kinase [Sphingobium sp. Sx8-8]
MIAAFKRLVARHWPVLRFRTIIFGTLLFVAALPGAGAVFLRVYENALVRRTEAELVAQGAALAAGASILWPGAESAPARIAGPYEEPATEVDLQSTVILPERPAPSRVHPPVDEAALNLERSIAPALAETKMVTLASIQILDRNGVVLNGYGTGGSLASVPEVAAALRGQSTTVLRRNASYRQVYPLEWLSRASSIRLHHARPIRAGGQVVGAILLSRSPRSLFKGIYEDRGKIALGIVLIFGMLVILSAVLARAIVRPVESLSKATRSMAQGRAAILDRPSLQVVEIRALYDDFEAMADAIAKRSRYLRDFAAALSHEFKTPLTSISGAIELLEDHGETMSESERQRFLTNITADADRLSRLVRRMMELAKADMGVPDGTEQADVPATLAKLADSYRSAAFNIRVDSPGALPAVRMDPVGLETITATIIDNARQAGASLLLIRTRRQHDQVVIEFADNGSGIAEGDRARLFEPFFTSKRDSGGTGMGLSIARSLAEAHGGRIDLLETSEGACFALSLAEHRGMTAA